MAFGFRKKRTEPLGEGSGVAHGFAFHANEIKKQERKERQIRNRQLIKEKLRDAKGKAKAIADSKKNNVGGSIFD